MADGPCMIWITAKRQNNSNTLGFPERSQAVKTQQY